MNAVGTSQWRLVCPVVIALAIGVSLLEMHASEAAILILLTTGVVLTGIPHGALDPFVARAIWSRSVWFSMPMFLALYSALAAVCILGWLADPNAALTLFLLLSAYHFGHDWPAQGRPKLSFLYGLAIVTLPCVRHQQSVANIYRTLHANGASEIVQASVWVGMTSLCLIGTASLITLRARPAELLEATFILLGAVFLDPLVFFACYFCLLHSPRHLVATADWLGLHSRTQAIRLILPATAASILLAIAAAVLMHGVRLEETVLQVMFIGIAGLTVPHMILIECQERIGQKQR